MATISKNNTFSAGATIIASEHNDNFDTIYNDYNGNVTNANIASGAAIGNAKLNLASIAQNVAFTGTLDFSSATITAETTFADLVATTADIDGGTLDGVAIGTADASIGTFTTLEASTSLQLATGATVTAILDENAMGTDSDTALATQQSIKAYADAIKPGLLFVSKTTWTNTTDSDDVVIVPNVRYLVVYTIHSNESGDPTLMLRFNDDDGPHYAGAAGEAVTASTSIALCTIGTVTEKAWAQGRFIMDTVSTDRMSASGEVTYIDDRVTIRQADTMGWWDNSATVADFQILSSQKTTGEIILYTMNEA